MEKCEAAFWPVENDKVCLKSKKKNKEFSEQHQTPGNNEAYSAHYKVQEPGDAQIRATTRVCSFHGRFSPSSIKNKQKISYTSQKHGIVMQILHKHKAHKEFLCFYVCRLRSSVTLACKTTYCDSVTDANILQVLNWHLYEPTTLFPSV